MKKLILSLIITALFGARSIAQELLTLEEAVNIALQNNYDIKIGSNNLEVAENNVSRVNAGMLPSVGAQVNYSGSIQNTKQVRADGQVQERNGARGSNFNYGPALNWTVFDGFAMFANYERLKELQKAGEANFRLTVQTTISDVITTYFDLVKQTQDIRATDTALAISKLRLNNAKARYEVGRAAKLEVLQASVDLNTDTTNLLRQKDLFQATQIALNELLARDLNTDFKVSDMISIDQNLKLPELKLLAEENNPNLQNAVISQRLASLNYRTIRAQRLPQIDVFSGYNFSKSTSALGFTTSNQARGLNYGITATIPVFNWGLQRRLEKNASLEIENSRLDLSRASQSVLSQLLALYQNYKTSIELVRLEANNVDIAKQNLNITLEKYRYGAVAPVEFREAQRNFINATTRYTSAQFEAKLAETGLKEVSGTINLR